MSHAIAGSSNSNETFWLWKAFVLQRSIRPCKFYNKIRVVRVHREVLERITNERVNSAIHRYESSISKHKYEKAVAVKGKQF